MFLFKEYAELSFATGTTISKDWTVLLGVVDGISPMVGAFIINISNSKSLRTIILG